MAVIYPWDIFPGGRGGQFSSALFVRGAIMHATDYPKGSFPGAVSKGILSGSNNLWVSCLGAIIRGNDPGGNYPGGNFPREQLSSGEIVLGAIFLGGNCPEGNFPWGQLSGDNHPGGNFPQGQLSGHRVRETFTCSVLKRSI